MKTNKIKFCVILVLIIVTSVLIVQTIRKPMPTQITGVQTIDSGTATQQQGTKESGTGLSGITGMALLQPKVLYHLTQCEGSLAVWQPAMTAGDIVLLDQDITTTPGTDCLIIDVPGITLDCEGYRIIGNNLDNGVVVTKSNAIGGGLQTEIKNCHFYNFSNISHVKKGRGIILHNRTNETIIFNNTFNRTRGILANSTHSITILNNTFVNYTFPVLPLPANDAQIQLLGDAAYNYDANNTLIANNIFEGVNSMLSLTTPYAVYAEYVNNLNIWNNTIQSSNKVEIQGANIFDIARNNLSRTEIETATGKNTINGTIRNNQYIDLNTAVMLTTGAGLFMRNVTFLEHNYTDFSLETTAGTFYDLRIFNNTFLGDMQINTVSGGTYGLRITDNTFMQPVRTTEIEVGELTLVSDNEFQHGEMYSIIISGDNTTVENNTFTNMTGRGIIVEANNATVRGNTFDDFMGIAILIGDDTWPPTDFVANTTVTDNDITLLVEYTNQTTLHTAISNVTSYNPPFIPSAGIGIFILPYTNFTNITLNQIAEDNGLGLNAETYGIYGATSPGNATENLYIYGNTITGVKNGINLRGCLTTQVLANTIQAVKKDGIKIENCLATQVKHNELTGGDDTLLFKNAIEIFKSHSDVLENNTIFNWHTGIYFYNATNTTSIRDNVTISTIGLLSFFSDSNEIQNDSINGTIGIKFLMTNNTLINDTTVRALNESISLSQSYFNNITNNDLYSTLTLFFDHNSANNNVTGNTVDCPNPPGSFVIYDLFSNNNNGTGTAFGGCPDETSRNFAHDNSIT